MKGLLVACDILLLVETGVIEGKDVIDGALVFWGRYRDENAANNLSIAVCDVDICEGRKCELRWVICEYSLTLWRYSTTGSSSFFHVASDPHVEDVSDELDVDAL